MSVPLDAIPPLKPFLAPPKENKGYFGVDINGKICIGGGWIKWCTTPYEQNLVAYPSKEAKKEACL